MLVSQGGACAICRKPFVKTPHVDHRHIDGKVRGLLCAGCNTKVASVESPLREAVERYLSE